MERLYPIRYDTIYGGKQPKMEFMQNDTEASKIAFELYEGNVAMTGIHDVSFTVERFDGNTYTYGSSNAVIEDNFVTITLPPSAVYTAGKCYITMSVYNDTLGRVTFGKFVYTVKEELVADQPLNSSEYYPVLIDLINANNSYNANYDEVLALSATNANLELVDARKGEATLGANIDKIYQSLANIAHINVAYVETWGSDTTGSLNRIGLPFSTINAALDALPTTGGIIKLGIGSFAPIDSTKMKHNVLFLGSQKPSVNDDYTSLVGGSIIKGRVLVMNYNRVSFKNLGIDCGAVVRSELGQGTIHDCLNIVSVWASQTLLPPNTGITIDNIECLCTTDALGHACLVENVYAATVSNVNVYNGTHGFVLKGIDCNVNNIYAYNAINNGVIIKDSVYARCNSNNIDNVVIRGGGGLRFTATETNMNLNMLNINNIMCDNTTFGVLFESGGTGKISDVTINNLKIKNCTGEGIKFTGTTERVLITNGNINYCTTGINTSTATAVDGEIMCKIFNASVPINNAKPNVIINHIGGVTVPTLLNGFLEHNVINSTPKYFISNGMVHLEGLIKNGAVGQILFVLPSGLRPLKAMRFVGDSDVGTVEIVVTAIGEVILGRGTYSFFSLDGISFLL